MSLHSYFYSICSTLLCSRLSTQSRSIHQRTHTSVSRRWVKAKTGSRQAEIYSVRSPYGV